MLVGSFLGDPTCADRGERRWKPHLGFSHSLLAELGRAGRFIIQRPWRVPVLSVSFVLPQLEKRYDLMAYFPQDLLSPILILA